MLYHNFSAPNTINTVTVRISVFTFFKVLINITNQHTQIIKTIRIFASISQSSQVTLFRLFVSF